VHSRLGLRRALAILAVYVVLGLAYTHPVLWKSATGIANDPYDPILNTSILWWNATTIPFSAEWWNPPHFHPAQGVAAFTENLVGVSVIATPVYWLTGSGLVAYNFSFFVSWPLCAFTAYLLAWFVVRRHDAAFLAGLIYGFSPYRTMELGHLQMLFVQWFPLALLGLHGFLAERRGWWLVLFGVAWVVQVLANGYYLFFGAVVIALWIVYFCMRSRDWRVLPAIVGTWVVANLVLAPIMWKYSTIQYHYGMHRTMGDAVAFSARPAEFFHVSSAVWFWHKVLPETGQNFFPGITALLVVVVGVVIAYARDRRGAPAFGRRRRQLIAILAAAFVLSWAAMLPIVVWGPFKETIWGIELRMTELDHAVGVTFWSALALVLIVTPLREALFRRSAFVFYTAMIVLTAILSTGPKLQTGEIEILAPMPYRWLMYLPGFDGIRVPNRFWMLGLLCMAVATAIAFARYGPTRPRTRHAVFALLIAGLFLDGWTGGMNVPDAPVQWTKVERRNRPEAVIELPLGPSWDAAATFRAMRHRRPVVNGVSGYDPSHYTAMQQALNDYDPAILVAFAAFKPLEIVVNGAEDPGGVWARYAASVAGEPILTDGTRRVYRLPMTPQRPATLGTRIPIAAISASADGAHVVTDGNFETEWHQEPGQSPLQWLMADLGRAQDVGGVMMGLGVFAWDYPRRLAIETSTDGASWEPGWEGPTAATAMLASIAVPREARLHFAFRSRSARYVRLRALIAHKYYWRVAELEIHGPA
jgi:hypothetical protein